MRPLSILKVLLILVTAAGSAVALNAQQPASPQPSLGDLARKLKAQRAKTGKKPPTVFTNDNVSSQPSQEAAPTEATTAAPAGTQPEIAATPPGPSSASPSGEVHDEKYFRGRMKELQDKLDQHRRQLEVLTQKGAQNQMQFYPDPNKALLQEYSRSDINKLNSDADKKRMEIEADEKAIDDLREQLRREGGSAAWLR